MARINQKVLCKRMEELELKFNSVNPIEADEIKKRLSKIESMLYACKDMLTSQEAADYTGLSLSQLYKMTSSMAIPYYKPRGKMVYFDKKELDNWMRQNPQLIIQTIRVHAER